MSTRLVPISGIVQAMLIALLIPAISNSRCNAQVRSANFVVYAPDPGFARQVAEQAEEFRKELAELWLGKELPTWPQPCPIKVEFQKHAGGETSFAFAPNRNGVSQPFDWRMKIYGPPERILDSVLPHEVTHTIFATHYGRPLPRWADEGACTTVEDVSERKKNHQMLLEFLTSDRGIPFNHMFAMKQYPRDILPLYAQGYSLARYLIMQKGHRHFVNFVGAGMQSEVPGREPQTWNKTTQEFYGYDNLSELQVQWLVWVKKGSPQLQRQDVAQSQSPDTRQADTTAVRGSVQTRPVSTRPSGAQSTLAADQSWYVQQSQLGGNSITQRPGTPTTNPAAVRGAPPNHYSPGSTRMIQAPRPMPQQIPYTSIRSPGTQMR